MPSFKSFSTVASGRSSVTLFDIRLDNDFIVFRGSEHESAGQTLKGSVVLCLSAPLKIEDVHLRFTGDLRFSWDQSRPPTSSLSSHKVDRHTELLRHRWAPFVKSQNGEKKVLEAGNYEWPFKLDLSGETPESVEGIPEASITYRLKATVARGKLSHDLHAYKPLRIVRTLEPSALEFLHAMSVENIWPNKVDYSIIIPQKAVVFGATVPLEMRFTPLLKGLEMGDVTIKMVEVREMSTPGTPSRDHRTEREVSSWSFGVTAEDNWQDMIGDTGQEGWTVNKKLNLPKRLKQCVQDVNHHGIKIRHKLKLVVALKNPDGHVSELRATLPVSIFISPNMPLDEHGVLLDSAVGSTPPESDHTTIAPPGYGEHILDQLFEDVDTGAGFQTPGIQSGFSSPFYAQSRAGSSDNLHSLGMTSAHGVAPAALTSRLQNVSLDPSERMQPTDVISAWSNPPTSHPSQPASAALTRHNSAEDERNGGNSNDSPRPSGRNSPEHVESLDVATLSKVPSYTTALKTPARSRAASRGEVLPDYLTAMSAPSTPMPSDRPEVDPLDVIHESVPAGSRTAPGTPPLTERHIHPWNRSTSMNSILQQVGVGDRRLHLMQARDRVV
ncbi:HECT-type ubiquitin ligase-interacting protein creD like [Verticillium longisporum]|nr:HECT-type ubiquitin ligase-interacting protein creD like [Verticillium longisporum]